MEELARIQTFIRVVEAGSFSAAARDLGSISSVARQVKSLEEELGVRLLNRNTRRLSLTEPGRAFYERSCKIANDLNNAASEARSFQEGVKGVLRVSLRVSAGGSIIVPALPTFLQQYPELILDISLTDERRELIGNNIDVAVWMGHLPDSEIVARRLSVTHRIVCGSPAYFKLHGVPAAPADLREHNCLLFSGREYGHKWGFTRGDQHEDVEIGGNFRTDNSIALVSAAIADLGLIVVHEWMVRLLISQGRLVKIFDDYTVNPRPGDAELYAVYASSRGLSRKVRAFVDFLVQLFQGSDVSAGVTTVPAGRPCT